MSSGFFLEDIMNSEYSNEHQINFSNILNTPEIKEFRNLISNFDLNENFRKETLKELTLKYRKPLEDLISKLPDIEIEKHLTQDQKTFIRELEELKEFLEGFEPVENHFSEEEVKRFKEGAGFKIVHKSAITKSRKLNNLLKSKGGLSLAVLGCLAVIGVSIGLPVDIQTRKRAKLKKELNDLNNKFSKLNI